MSRVDAVWLYAGARMGRSQLYEVLDTVEGWRTPTLLTRLGERQPVGATIRDGVVAGPADAEPEQLRLILASLICQGQMMRQIKDELSIIQRHHRGLLSQIDQLDEELRLAARIQRQFLPTILPTLGNVSFDVLFRPASYVSGDMYDVVRLDEHHLGFYVADAVGHGVPAALLTMFIKQALQTKEVVPGGYRIVPPDEALAKLNRDLLARQSSQTQFVTACYGTIDIRTRELSLARAGHPSPLLLAHGGSVSALTPEGPLLGVFEDEPFELMSVTLDPGDRLLIYSDGFELAFGDHRNDAQRHMDALKSLRVGALEDAVDRLSTLLDTQAGSLHQRDDMTALMLDIAVDIEEPITGRIPRVSEAPV
jgi:serine phosphatase RsbU (regulator of sigma subunit)